MTDEEYATCLDKPFNKLDYQEIPKKLLMGEKWMHKSVNIGDQLSQILCEICKKSKILRTIYG